MDNPKAKPELIGDYHDLKDLRTKVRKWLTQYYSGKYIINQQTGFEIGFNSKSFDKLVSGKTGELKLIALTSIEEIISTGLLERKEEDKKLRSDILAFYYFTSVVEIYEVAYKYWFTVRQLKNGKFIYSGNLDSRKTL